VSRVSVVRDGAIWKVGLNRPEKRNALDQETVNEIDAVLAKARQSPSIIVLYSTTPGIFAAGADIAELIKRDADSAMLAINAAVFERLEQHRWPTIAVIDGPAIGGGCELALACDLRIASPRASFGQPELSVGILAGAGANSRLPQLVGIGLARRMLYTGLTLDADKAAASGLVDELAEDPAARAEELAVAISARSWRALELTKLSLRAQRTSSMSFDLAAQSLLFESEDKHARMAAFLDSRHSRLPVTRSDEELGRRVHRAPRRQKPRPPPPG